ncbi:flavodoxin domain-containing protein [Streptomyces sp. NPDC099088]|uniref:flavodoxin domain-containing protein n=1 Tax=Streptomyces sp. NPDC099088 TaxID=3366101 RepID=UPI00382BF050
MVHKILVAYGTTNGSTARIAEIVAENLRKGGVSAETLPAGSVTTLAPYDAVVVGGALYGGRWHKDCRSFVSRNRRELGTLPLWFFSSGPLDSSASVRNIPPVSGVKRVMARLDVKEHVTFGGCLQEGATGYVARKIVSSGKGGDFRDVEQIEAWAAGIGRTLTAGEAQR